MALVKVGACNLALYESPHPDPSLDPDPALIALINSAKSTLFCSIYSLTAPAIRDAITAAAKRGVTVTVVADAGEAATSSSLVPSLVAANIPVRVWGDSWRLCHLKAAVADGQAVALGSLNWTIAAERSNVECLLIFTGVEVGRGGLAASITAQINTAYQAGKPIAISTGGTP